MAAYAALVSLMQIINQLKSHPFPPVSIDEKQVESLTENITSLQSFLEKYSSPFANNDDESDPLEIRIAKAAYAAEDAIESHIVHAIEMSRYTATHDQETDEEGDSDSGEETESGSSEEEEEGASYINNLYQETSPGEETTSSSGEGTTSGSSSSSGKGSTSGSGEGTDSGEGTSSSSGEEASWIISNLYQDLHQVIKGMQLIKKEAKKINTEKVLIHASVASSTSTPTGLNIAIVRPEKAILEIKERLDSNPSNRCTIPIVGMGGIGKTFLARLVYSDQYTVERFDIRLWATISHQHDVREILCELVSQATGENKEQLSERSVGQLQEKLHKCLFGRRYLVVMDDMWGVDAWDSIRKAFPENKNSSRVLVTTRLEELGSTLNDYSLHMEFLDEDNGWDLFSKTVFGDEKCPPKLKEIGKKIVESCRGLPLSIVVVGGLLKKMEGTQECWKSIWEDLTSRVSLDNDKHCFKLLKVSYNHLPAYVKPCFLYMGVFDEDDEIDVSALVKLWISEGFLKPVKGKSLETVARGFLKDLLDRNLILTEESWFGRTGNMKYCRIHDLLRDICLAEGQKDGFFHVIGQDSHHGLMSRRRIVIHESASKEEIFDTLGSLSCIRSVISNDDDDDKVEACKKSRLLRTLNARNQVDGIERKPLVFRFVNLRHVIVEAHSRLSITHLWNLHTLIVYSYEKLKAPVGIWRMPQLRHIEFMEHKMSLPDPPTDNLYGVVVMENLHTLKGVENFRFGAEVVKRIPNIKRLLIEYGNVEGSRGANDDDYHLSNVESLTKLESLTCGEPIKEGRRVSQMQKLTFPHSIKKLTLTMSYDEDMLGKMGSLPLLQKLKMLRGSFITGEWEVIEGQFPCLTSLTLLGCRGLKQWKIEESSSSIFPRLEHLRLSGLTRLEEIPMEIGDISTLQEIELQDCSESAVLKCEEDIVRRQEELQGEVDFRVSVLLRKRFEALKSLASPNFKVEVTEFV